MASTDIDKTNIDRLSQLDNPMIHHIFSFLDMKHVISTCMVSKRFDKLWCTQPTLKVSSLNCVQGSNRRHTLKKYSDFMFRLLIAHTTDPRILCLTIEWDASLNIQEFPDGYDVENSVDLWTQAAVLKYNVQELNLRIISQEEFKLPCSLYNSKTLLERFEFCGAGRDLTGLILPKDMKIRFPKLQSLALKRIKLIGDENLTSEFFASCPRLERLQLINCYVKFDFSSGILNHFELDTWCTYPSLHKQPNTVKLSAPNLKSLICKDFMSTEFSLQNLSSLVTAEIAMRVLGTDEDYQVFETPKTYSGLSTEKTKLYGARMVEILRAVYNVNDLTLSFSPGFLEVVSGHLDLLSGDLNFQFWNLRNLKAVTWVSGNCMSVIAFLVQRSPNIESISLTIEEIELDNNNTGYDWILESGFPGLHYLKVVRIRRMQGCLNEIRFLQALLMNAPALQKVTLFKCKTDSSDALQAIKQTLLSSPSASSSVSISIQR